MKQITEQKPKTHRVFLACEYTDAAALADYLNTQAAKGWRCVSIRHGIQLEACEPGAYRYDTAVQRPIPYEHPRRGPSEWMGESDLFDPSFSDVCADAGWRCVGHKRSLFVFETQNADAVPLIAQDATSIREYADTVRACGKWHRRIPLFLSAFMLLLLGLYATNLFFGEQYRRQIPYDLMLALPALAWLIVLVGESIREAHRYRRVIRAAESGTPLPPESRRVLYVRTALYALLTVLTFGAAAAILWLDVRLNGAQDLPFLLVVIGLGTGLVVLFRFCFSRQRKIKRDSHC